MSSFRAIAASVVMVWAASLTAADVVVESRPGGINYSNYKELAGNWLDSNTPADTAKSAAQGLTVQGQLGSRKVTLKAVPDPADTKVVGRVQFSLKLTEAGHYHVYITWPRAANATPVNIIIKHAKGEEKRALTQNGWGANGAPNADAWLALGEYDFNAGEDQYVEMLVLGSAGATDPRNPAQAYSDAVRFSTDPVAGASTPLAAAEPQTVSLPTAKVATPISTTGAAGSAPAAGATEAGPIAWQDLAAGRAAANTEKKNLLIFFYAPGNVRSDDLEQKSLNDPRVKGAIKTGYVPVKVNMETDRAFATQAQVFRAGTINLYDSTGNGLATITTAPDAPELLQELSKH